MSTNAVDLTKMSAAEIKAFIESQPQPVVESVEMTMGGEVVQPRDEQGRFVSTQADPVVEAQAEPVVAENIDSSTAPESITVEREIDLGDGSGIQVFRGTGENAVEAYEVLADELIKAQANATKKIRELSRPAAPAPVVETTPENDFLLAQRIMDTPRAAIRDLLKEEFGLSPAEIKAKLAAADEIAKERKRDTISGEFMAAHPDYYASQSNAARLIKQLKLDGLEETTENLAKVYNELKADGLITPKPAEAAPVIRTRSSGLSTRSSVPPPPPKPVDTSKLTPAQLLELAGGYQNVYR
jgi:hypothetical protein